jgi:hypothetical protein
MTRKDEMHAHGSGELTGRAEIIRGSASWTYILIVLGFALAIEGNIVQLLTPFKFPWKNLVLYLALMVATAWFFLFNRWFRRRLFAIQHWYESRSD